MRRTSWAELSAEVRKDPERRAQIEAMKQAMLDAAATREALREVRTGRGVTQEDLARALNVTQSRVSRIERDENLYLSTLREYVAALGGELELRAVFPDEVITLGLGDHANAGRGGR